MTALKNKNAILLSILMFAAFAVPADNAANTNVRNNKSDQIPSALAGGSESRQKRLYENEANIDSTNLKLHGIFAFSDTRVAYLSINGAEQQAFTEGRKITDGWSLKTILPDRIITRHNGSDVLLRLESDGGKVPAAKALSYRPPPALPAHAAADSRPPIDGIKKIQPNYLQIKRSLVQKELKSGSILSQARIIPEKGGGFFVERIKDGSLMEDVGLHVGDVIQSINNKPLNTVYDALDALDQIETDDSVELKITRSGDTQHLYYDLK